MDDQATVLRLDAKSDEAKVDVVTVYQDRAEVTRRCQVDLKAGSSSPLLDVVVRGLSSQVEADSVRVRVVKSSAAAGLAIREVCYEKVFVTPEDLEREAKEKSAERKSELEAQLKASKLEAKRLSQIIHRLATSLGFVTSYVADVCREPRPSPTTTTVSQIQPRSKAMVMKKKGGGGGGGECTTIERSSQQPHYEARAPASVEEVSAVLDLYEQRAEQTDEKRNATELELEACNVEIARVEAELRELRGALHPKGYYEHLVTVGVQLATAPSNDERVELLLTYVVRGASWSPSYDARVSSSSSSSPSEGGGGAQTSKSSPPGGGDDDDDEGLTLTYYAQVRQHTGEDWRSAKMLLSTATPSVGGKPPSIRTKHVRFASAFLGSRQKKFGGGPPVPMMQQQQMVVQSNFLDMQQANMLNTLDDESLELEAESRAETTNVRGGASAAEFEVAGLKTVLSDNKPHKLTVGVIPMAISKMHYTVPELDAKVYLQARALNTSDYPLLASESVSVYFGGSFVGRTSVDHISPGESFDLFLGIDSAVKVDFKPVKKLDRTHGGGLFSSKSTKSTTYSALAVVTNSKREGVRVTVAMQLPLANDEKIVVRLQSPKEDALDRSDSDLGDHWAGRRVRKNPKTNNIVWLLPIPAGQTEEVAFEYRIEHPKDKSVEIY